MTLVHELLQRYVPSKRKQTAKGWIQFNCPACHHRGHGADTRGRGNILFTADQQVVYRCFNCGIKARYAGNHISHNIENIMRWMGVPHNDLQKAKLEALELAVSGNAAVSSTGVAIMLPSFGETDLPAGARPISEIAMDDDPSPEFMSVLAYLYSRGKCVAENWDYHWSPDKRHNMDHRVIIPFRWNRKIVGWTARYAGKPPGTAPRYFNSELDSGYLFNADQLSYGNRKFVLINEGPFDAIATDGIGTLGSKLSPSQIAWLNLSDRIKIVVPDRETKNQALIDIALEQGWSVSFPDWERGVKDAAKAAELYGRLYTIQSILATRTSNRTEIAIKRQLFKG